MKKYLHHIYLGWRRASCHTTLEVVCTVPSGNNIFKPCLLVTCQESHSESSNSPLISVRGVDRG